MLDDHKDRVVAKLMRSGSGRVSSKNVPQKMTAIFMSYAFFYFL